MRHDRLTIVRHFSALLGGSFWVLLLVVALSPHRALAQSTEWRERRTASFAILYPDGSEAEAENYAQFVDGVYDEVSAVFNYRTPPPVILRIYPTMELYVQANPLAAQMPGVVAHANTGRREISIALPQTANQPPDQIINNVRHELTHVVAADLSDNKLTTAFQEGIAQYLEYPSAELDAKMQLMQQAISEGRVLAWSDLNQPGVAYADPRIGYPESYTIVAFLIQRNDVATFRTFIERMKTSSGYRSALEAAYGVGADQLEQEWRGQLEAFVRDGYRKRANNAFDLSQAEALIARGDYEQAIQQLDSGIATLREAGQDDLLRRAEQLRQQASNGQRATTLAAEARSALERSDYPAAKQAARDGREILEALSQAAQIKIMDEYVQLADAGLAAQQQLGKANADLRTLHIGTARTNLHSAYQTFTRLGDEDGAARAQSSLLQIQRTETIAAAGLVVLAALVLGWNIQRRANERDKALPFG